MISGSPYQYVPPRIFALLHQRLHAIEIFLYEAGVSKTDTSVSTILYDQRLLKTVYDDNPRSVLDRVTKIGYHGNLAIGAVGTDGAVLNSSVSKDRLELGPRG